MAKPPRLYTRLTRPTSSLGSYKSLWRGPDHLLVVTSTGYTEEYRRILFRDIQGIFLLETTRRQSWAIGWGIAGLLFGLGAIATLFSGGRPVVLTVLLAIALGALLWNHLLGAGCKVHVITGVQTLQLPSLVRRKKARKVLRQLDPLIVAAQQDLPASAPPPPPAALPPAPPEPPPLPSL